MLINSPSTPNASGLKAGGVLVADSYDYANPGKNDLIVKGDAGIGTAAPESKLHISGRSGLAPFQGLTIDQTLSAIGDTSGYTLQVRTTDRTLPMITSRTDLLIDSAGNVGLGTASPTSKLEVAAQDGLAITGFQPFLTLRDTNDGGARGIIASGNGDLSLYPNSFVGGVAALTVKNGSGNVGIGTVTPTSAKLVVNDTGVGTAVAGVSATGSGVFGQSASASGWGVYGRNTVGGYAVYADGAAYAGGDARQAPYKGGWVKAMAIINKDGTVARCYTVQTVASTGNCVDVSHPSLGIYDVVFGFQVEDRFVSLTAEFSLAIGHSTPTVHVFFAVGPEVRVGAEYPDNGDDTDTSFSIYVF